MEDPKEKDKEIILTLGTQLMMKKYILKEKEINQNLLQVEMLPQAKL